MKLLVIGLGQCGGRMADSFARLGGRARMQRGLDIITGCYAVNTDVADLTGLRFIPPDPWHRIVLGRQRAGGHGVGKVNEVAARIAREDGDTLLEAIRMAPPSQEPDAFLLASSAAGGTGSGTIPVFTQLLKENFPQKPVYNLIILPFKHEEQIEERSVYNTATCLKSSYLVADAIFLVDNQRLANDSLPINENLARINTLVTEPFYNLLCAGEERKPEFIGSRTLDAGDIMETLAGWVAIGYGTVPTDVSRPTGPGKTDFWKKATDWQVEARAINAALSGLSLKCNPLTVRRALYLVCAPPEATDVDLVSELGATLKHVAPDATIRGGDYPRGSNSLGVTIVLAGLTSVSRVTDYFNRVILSMSSLRVPKGGQTGHLRLEDAFRGIPSLV